MSTTANNTAANTAAPAKKRFLSAEVGLDAKNKAHAFHVEGYISQPPRFNPATDEKDAFLGTSMGIGMNPERLMALANGTFDKNTDYGEANGFVGLRVYGKLAEDFSAKCAKGLKVAVSGELAYHDWTDKDGNAQRDVTINVSNIAIMGSRTEEPILSNRISVGTLAYKSDDGVVHTVPMAEQLTGKVVNVKPLATGGADNMSYFSFGVLTQLPAEKIYDMVNGISTDGKEYEKNKRIVNVVVFRNRAEALSKIIRKGTLVVLTGPVKAREYNGETSYQMSPRVASIMKFAPRDDDAAAQGPAPAGTVAAELNPSTEADNDNGFAPMDDDDMELPF